MGDLLELHGALTKQKRYYSALDRNEYDKNYLLTLRNLAAQRIIELEEKQQSYQYSRCYSLFLSTLKLNKYIVDQIDQVLKVI